MTECRLVLLMNCTFQVFALALELTNFQQAKWLVSCC